MDRERSLMLTFNGVKDALMACDVIKIRELFAEAYEDFGIRGEISDRNTILAWYKRAACK